MQPCKDPEAMPVYQHILVAIDFNTHSATVLQHASALAQSCDAALTVLHVVDYSTPSDADNLIAVEDATENRLINESERQLRTLLEREALSSGVRAVVGSGHPGIEIVRHAERENADLVVIGLRTGHGIEMLAGHTVHHVLTSAGCNVLLVR
jgi:universal stress protein A